MNILVYEYFSSGGPELAPEAEALHSMGWAMLRACIEDCLGAGHQVCTLLDRRLSGKLPPACTAELVAPGLSLSAFKEMLNEVDAVLLIAPETDGILTTLTSLVEESGKLLLGSTGQATRIATDKLASSRALANHGCRVPATARWPTSVEELPTPGPWVLKPRSGAGCKGIYLTASPDTTKLPHEEYLIQEYVPGIAASVAMIAGKSNTIILSLNLQRMVFDPAPHYKGGFIPLVHPLSKAALASASIVPQAIPGLRGYVGVDMVLTRDNVYIIEVNPRVTCAYCGLRRVVSTNLMEVVIQAALGFDLHDEVHVSGSVQFDELGNLA